MKTPNYSNRTNLVERLILQIKSAASLFEKKKFEEKSSQWLAIVMVLACLIAVWSYKTHSELSTFVTSNGTWNIASNIVNGDGFSACDTNYFPFCSPSNQSTAMREPVPVLLMAAAMLIYPDEDAGLILQAVLYLGTALAIYFALKKEDARLALLASFLWIVSIPVITEMQDDTGHMTAAFFFTIGMFFFLRGYREQKFSHLILSGIFLGIASLSRTVHLGTAIGLGLVLIGLQVRARSMKGIFQAIIFLAIVCLTIAPWVIRNKMALGAPLLGSSLTGYNIYRMNFYIENDPFQLHYVGGAEGAQAIQQLVENSDLTGTENEAQMNSFYMKEGKRIILEHPFRYVVLILHRFLLVWFNFGFRKSYGEGLLIRDYLAIIQQIFFLIAVTVGAVKKYKEYWPLALSIVLECGAYMAVSAQLRYTVDLMPNVVILSAFALSSLPFMKKITN